MRLKAFPRIPVAPKPPDISLPGKLSGDPKIEEALVGVRAALRDQAQSLDAYFKDLQTWQDRLRNNLVAREDDIDRAVNGGIQLAKPFSNEQNPSANVRMVFRHFFFDNDATSTAAVCIDPQFGDGKTPPRGWFPIQIQEVGLIQNTRPILILDQILSSADPSPSVAIAGYALAKVDAANPRLIKGDSAAAPNGWVGNDVRVGDQISLLKTFAGPGTITVVVGNTTVVGIGTTFTQLHILDYIRLTGVAGFEEWKQVIDIVDDLNLVVGDAFRVSVAGAAYEEKIADDGWLRISKVTLGVLTEDTLTLDPLGPGTQVPLASTGVQYVIRRPPTAKKLWVRVLSESPNPVAATLGIF